MLIHFAETEIFKTAKKIVLSASLPGKGIYKKFGYIETGYEMIAAHYGDYLCFDTMEKRKPRAAAEKYDLT